LCLCAQAQLRSHTGGKGMEFIVRTVHVSAASFLLCGSLLLFLLVAFQSVPSLHIEPAALLRVMTAYELGFWTAAGAAVATGVGNLGAFGEALPDTSTAWGATFTWKLAVAFAVLALSVVRTAGLVLLEARGAASSSEVASLGRAYGGSAVLFAAMLALAVSLAHF
jgi:hypothetical protein